MAEPALFQTLYNGFQGPLINGSTNAADALLTAAGPDLAGALGLFVIVCGVMTMVPGGMTWSTAVLNCVRAVAVAHVLTAPLYNQYVETMFLQTIPAAIVAAIGGGNGAAGNVAAQFDALQNAVDHQAAVLMTANAGLLEIPDRISIFLADQFCGIMLMLCFFVDFIAQALMALVAPVGAILLLAYLFRNTRHWAERWIGNMVALLVLELMVAVLLAIILSQFKAYMGASEAGALSTDSAGNIHQMWMVGLFFFFGAALLLLLPPVAAAIGGSHVSNVVVTHINMASSAASRLASAAGNAATRGKNNV